MNKKTIRDIQPKHRRLLVRVDFNVPLKDGKVVDDTRIRAALPTIQYLTAAAGEVILCSHLGRPKGGPEPKYSLRPAAERLSELLSQPVLLVPDCVGTAAEHAAAAMLPGQVILL
jgi:phosphoglycerate kinase